MKPPAEIVAEKDKKKKKLAKVAPIAKEHPTAALREIKQDWWKNTG